MGDPKVLLIKEGEEIEFFINHNNLELVDKTKNFDIYKSGKHNLFVLFRKYDEAFLVSDNIYNPTDIQMCPKNFYIDALKQGVDTLQIFLNKFYIKEVK